MVANGADIALRIEKPTFLSLFLFDAAFRLNEGEVRPSLGRGRNDFGSHFVSLFAERAYAFRRLLTGIPRNSLKMIVAKAHFQESENDHTFEKNRMRALNFAERGWGNWSIRVKEWGGRARIGPKGTRGASTNKMGDSGWSIWIFQAKECHSGENKISSRERFSG